MSIGSFVVAGLPSCDTDIEKLETDANGVFSCGSIPAIPTVVNVKSGTLEVTEGGSGGDVTFGTAFSGTPFCSCTAVEAADAVCWYDATPSTTAISINFNNQSGGPAATETIHWICTDAGDP